MDIVSVLVGVFLGFLISFFWLKNQINKTGAGEMHVCKKTCPYYSTHIKTVITEGDSGLE